ncbi:glycosyl hydrolase [Mucilaginibacter dorajii]|uniref:glycosyl hydrolase n=1 Tax=Mucilaginibacter dorajii TaxID=692994 RepID=UPI002169F09A|nr:glycosyl hydrolase [Mucilaginibacter dorajii]MCS3732324.1 hypothetical protein [Mucilaginibacter dorajii]
MKIRKYLLALSAGITGTACICGFTLYTHPALVKNQKKEFFSYYDFNPATFRKAPRAFGPLTRWWWPGNDVTDSELKREINMFAENGFAGVEVQPLFEGLNEKGNTDRLQKQLSWDTPSFYEHIRVVMQAARKAGMIVDMNAGSGWPIGGPQVTPDSSIMTLTYADTLVTGARQISIQIPRLKQAGFTINSKSPLQFYQTVSVDYAKLQGLVVAKVVKQENGQTFLDPNTVKNLTSKVTNNQLSWQVPEGNWKVISFWSMPDGELPKAIASRPMGFVADFFNAEKLRVRYNHLFGPANGLETYYGNPLRAIFNDSYEFMTDRHYADSFLSFFKQQRGYDMVPFFAPNIRKFYNNAYILPYTADLPFPFVYGDDDWRLRYDYDLTVSELLKTQFIQFSNQWLHQKGLLHRTQAYGARMDVIGNSGEADIPETEQLAGNNSEGFLKLIASGAHLNNKPIITQESFVFRGLAEMTTLQKIKLLADKSFAAGVNQIIYHGSPYKYQTGEFGKEGWNTFSSPFKPGNNFSSNFNESSPFWKDIKTINKYITRSQYLLQAGRPHADVLIYFPFIDFYPEQVSANPKEILVSGRFKGVEPEGSPGFPSAKESGKIDQTKQWFTDLWPLINKLEAAGITWDFVNDDALQKATLQQGEIVINNNKYSSLVLSNLPYMQMLTAENVNRLSKGKARLLIFGNAPTKQPSYLNFKENDAKTAQFIQVALSQPNTKQIKNEESLDGWIAQLPAVLRFSKPADFTRATERLMNDGSRIKFIWNESDHWQTISLMAGAGYEKPYWINAENGTITKNNGNSISYLLPPYGSIFLYTTQSSIPENMLSSEPPSFQHATDLLKLDTWDIKIGDTVLYHSGLFDWKNNRALQYRSGAGIYTSTFKLPLKTGKKYVLDLGAVCFTAEIMINGKPAGKRLWAPYQLDITSFLKTGNNKIEVRITPTSRNEFIGEAMKGNSKYAQYKGQEKTLMPAGLVGPVTIKLLNSR